MLDRILEALDEELNGGRRRLLAMRRFSPEQVAGRARHCARNGPHALEDGSRDCPFEAGL